MWGGVLGVRLVWGYIEAGNETRVEGGLGMRLVWGGVLGMRLVWGYIEAGNETGLIWVTGGWL